MRSLNGFDRKLHYSGKYFIPESKIRAKFTSTSTSTDEVDNDSSDYSNTIIPYPPGVPCFELGLLSNQSYVNLEIMALQVLYASTNGGNWTHSYGWNTTISGDPCSGNWYGIVCSLLCDTPTSCICSITQVVLYHNNLQGFLPSELSYLSTLQALILSSNHISGPIPSELSKLSRLEFLMLGDNSLSGQIPSELGMLTNLKTLELIINLLTGRIPESIGNLQDLVTLMLQHNKLNETLPDHLQNLSNLIYLRLDQNFLSGPIPSWISSFKYLRYLSLFNNHFSSSIPTELGLLQNLWYLGLYSNQLEGSLPTELGKLTSIYDMNLFNNSFDGKIPSELGNLRLARVLVISSNNLTGHLPVTLLNLHNLESLYLHSNRLSGKIPSGLFLNLAKLRVLELGNNFFSGCIPSNIGFMSELLNLGLESNRFTGPLPTDFLMPELQVLDVSNNMINGTMPSNIIPINMIHYIDLGKNIISGMIPTTISRFQLIEALILYENRLTGPIPSTIGLLRHLSSLWIGSNRLNGTIPEEFYCMERANAIDLSNNSLHGLLLEDIYKLNRIRLLSIENNQFSGKLPTTLGSTVNLVNLFVSYNRFTGTLPSELQYLPKLQWFDCSNNLLSGSIENLFNVSSQIKYLSFNNNKFTGRLPKNAFCSPYLSSFSAAINCFDHELTGDDICRADNLQFLNLDGMSAAASCSQSRGLQRTRPLPTCLLSLRNINTVHMSGNLLTGILPYNTSSSLQNLDLSHNLLRGNITAQTYIHKWNTINLGFNKINGVLPREVSAGASVTLTVNRLSGSISSSYRNLSSVFILRGNLFDCDSSRNDIPTDDPDSLSYECGSDSTNSSFYVFLAFFFCIYFIIYYFRGLRPSSPTAVRKINFLMYSRQIFYSSVCMMGLAFLGLVMTSVLHSYYSTYSEMYAWSVSFGYLTGVPAGASLIVYITISSMTISFCFSYAIEEDSKNTSKPQLTRENSSIMVLMETQKTRLYTGVALFVYFNVSFAIFKATYQSTPVLIKDYIAPRCSTSIQHVFRRIASADNRAVLNLFSIMIAPCVATSIAYSDCFYYYIFSSEPVVSYQSTPIYSLSYNNDLNLARSYTFQPEYVKPSNVVETVYTPTFLYSYQCASALMTAYVTVFVYLALITGIVFPLLRLWLRWCQVQLNNILESNCNAWCGNCRRLANLLNNIEPNILSQTFRPNFSLTGSKSDYMTEESNIIKARKVVERSFKADSINTQIITLQVLGITFGLVFPPLGIVIFLSILSLKFLINLEVEYFLTHVDENLKEPVVEQLKLVFLTFDTRLSRRSTLLSRFLDDQKALLLTALACLFMGYFLFDTLGDSLGFTASIMISTISIASILLLTSIGLTLFKHRISRATNSFSTSKSNSIEKEQAEPATLSSNFQYFRTMKNPLLRSWREGDL